VISLELTGLEEAIAAVRSLPTTIGMESAFESAAQRASAILREQTPPGFTGQLGAAASYKMTDGGFVVGYSRGVERRGNPRLDSVRRPRTAGRSVLNRPRRWVTVDELRDNLEDTIDSNADEILSIIERSVVSGLS